MKNSVENVNDKRSQQCCLLLFEFHEENSHPYSIDDTAASHKFDWQVLSLHITTLSLIKFR